MTTDIQQIAQLGGTVFTVVAFLYYMRKRDELNKKTYDEFNSMINNHLHTSNKVIERNSKSLQKVAVNLKEISMLIKKNNGGERK